MKIEDQVCDLDLAKRLKELRVKQDSYFYWSYGSVDDISLQKGIKKGNYLEPIINISAFTVAELGEILPNDIISYRQDENWFISKRKTQLLTSDKTEANVRAKMLIYLLEK